MNARNFIFYHFCISSQKSTNNHGNFSFRIPGRLFFSGCTIATWCNFAPGASNPPRSFCNLALRHDHPQYWTSRLGVPDSFVVWSMCSASFGDVWFVWRSKGISKLVLSCMIARIFALNMWMIWRLFFTTREIPFFLGGWELDFRKLPHVFSFHPFTGSEQVYRTLKFVKTRPKND